MRFAAILLLASACASTSSTDKPSFLFVQHSDRAILRGGKLMLQGVGENVVYFSDRPQRVAGHLRADQLLDGWDKGKGSFAETPPNAVLSIFHSGGVRDVVVVLRNPTRSGQNLVYDVEVLDGPQSAEGGPAALFIDNLAPWPVVRNGMHTVGGVGERRGSHINR